jgi:hypothetical protein
MISVMKDLITFGRKRKYSDPEFVSEQPIGPTVLKFFLTNLENNIKIPYLQEM